MSWNFDTSSKIRRKTQKNRQKIILTSLWRHFRRFLTEIKFSLFSGIRFSKYIEKLRHRGIFSIFELQIFFYNFWQSFSPIGAFLGNLSHFSFFTCFVLEVPENCDFQKKYFSKWLPSEKYATYEAQTLQKVVSSNKTNLQKVSGIHVLRGKICGEKTSGGVTNDPPPVWIGLKCMKI